MSIKTGTEGGGAFKRRRKTPATAQAQKPFRPVENTFPEKRAFRLGQYKVLEEKDDYCICKGFDPNAENPFAQFTPSTPIGKISVAKPPALQRTPWDGKSVDIYGVTYTFEYSDTEKGVRTVRWTDDNGVELEEEQRIDVSYTLDDDQVEHQILVAVEIRKNAAVDGTDVREEAESEDDEPPRLRWMDLNVSGRHWKVSKAVPTRIRFTIVSADPNASPPSAVVTVDAAACNTASVPGEYGGQVTVYDTLGCLLDEAAADLVDRKGFADYMDNGTTCRWEISSLCCP